VNEYSEYLIELIKNKPKHYAIIIKKNPDLLAALGNDQLLLPERVYRYINPMVNTVCPNNKEYKFKSAVDGYIFCGKASTCQCAKESVAQSVSNTKQQYTNDTQKIINEKRKQTNVKKYGTENTGQIKKAIDNHRKFYSDTRLVAAAVDKSKHTKLTRYGSETYNNSQQIKDAWNKKKVEYFAHKFPDKEIEILNDTEKLTALYKTHTVDQIAEKLNVHIQTVYRHLNNNSIRTPFSSELERSMCDYLESLGVINIVKNTRQVISKELDIYLPDYNLAIEMNGIYWHHDLIPHIDRHYHQRKFKECEAKGIRLLTIFSDVWENKPDVIKLMIAHKLGVNNTEKYYARKLQVKDVDPHQASVFLNKHHIQGNTKSSVRLGLWHGDLLVAIMTFGEPRTGIGKKRPKTAELVRYATSSKVVGGASKLLAHFKRNYPDYCSIISYSDNEWSYGDMYRTLGFDLEKEHTPSYFYYHSAEKVRKHRYSFAKHKLVEQGFDATLTEYQIQQERGYLRIWDCGKRTWLLTV